MPSYLASHRLTIPRSNRGLRRAAGAGSRGRAGEDLDLIDRLLRAGAMIRYEPEAVVYHERQDRTRRLASRSGYGHGVGAACGLRLREGDRHQLLTLGAWLLLRGRVTAKFALSGRWEGLHEERLVLRGTLDGLVYGFRNPRVSE
jgi:hypothetical protein